MNIYLNILYIKLSRKKIIGGCIHFETWYFLADLHISRLYILLEHISATEGILIFFPLRLYITQSFS